MAIKNRLSALASRDDSGLAQSSAGRFVNKDGTPNVRRKGLNFLSRFSWYHTMLNLSSARFIFYLIFGYILINIFFALLYYIIGVEHLTGIDSSTPLNEFIDVFFFSSQTFTTVGYGRIAPVGFMASLVSTFEAFLGLLAFAIATGLFYGRFSRPRAFIKFSKNALIAPYKDGTALMFRMVPFKNNALSDAHVLVNTVMEASESGITANNYYRLNLEMAKIDAFSLNWTVVHKIDEESPFFGFTEEDFRSSGNNFEIMVQLRAFDEVFANTVVQRTSYLNSEIIYGAKFQKMYAPSSDKNSTVLDLDRLDDYERVTLPASDFKQN